MSLLYPSGLTQTAATHLVTKPRKPHNLYGDWSPLCYEPQHFSLFFKIEITYW